MKLLHGIAILIVLYLCCACSEPEVLGGEITIQNHILDKSYNTFVVDRVTTKRGRTAFRKRLKPEDSVTLPYKAISSLRFKRRYKDHAKIYVVKCPPDANKRIVMKLIDVHTNKIQGGCKLVKRGIEKVPGFVEWE